MPVQEQIRDNMQINLKGINLNSIDFKDPKVQNVVLMILLGLIALVLFVTFIFIPQVTNDVRMIGKTFKVRSDLKSARSLIADKENLKKKFDEYDSKIEVYEKKLPAQQEIPDLLESLSKMARNADISIVGITPVPSKLQKDRKGQVYKEIPILITAKSGYHELGRFLSNMENTDRFMKVVDIKIRANAAAPKRHDVELMVYTYVLSGE
jgi:type IV pilus assembly protein PilO